MTATAVAYHHSFDWRRLLSLLILITLLLPLLGTTQASAGTSPVQPQLLELAAQQPTARIGVIVQKLSKDSNLETLVARLGGTVTQDLPIINAFAAELPAHAARELAQSDGVRWVSLDAPVVKSAVTSTCTLCISTSLLKNNYVRVIGADKVWNVAPYLQGQGVGVAVVDSGVSDFADFSNTQAGTRVIKSAKFNSNTNSMSDGYGHGTHVAGIIGGNGTNSLGAYIGVAPKVNLINVKVSDDVGMASASDVVAGLQWVNDNRATYNIRVVNLSLNSSVNQSYHVDPMAAAAEILWFNGVVVVASAGNTANGGVYPPANDPFVITVGATDDKATLDIKDDALASFSAHGSTVDGFSKPDLVAPGKNIVSVSASNSTTLATEHPLNILATNNAYFQMSGTSMAAPMVAGAAALLLQDEPGLTPDQVKYRLKATAKRMGTGTGSGYVNVYTAVTGTTTASANTGIAKSKILTGGGSETWNSASWGSASWGSASWGSASWGSASWGSDYWGK